MLAVIISIGVVIVSLLLDARFQSCLSIVRRRPYAFNGARCNVAFLVVLHGHYQGHC